jgi:isochorismate synthase
MNNIIQKKIGVEEQLLNALSSFLGKGYPVAIWRQPKTHVLHLIADSSGDIKKVPLQIEDLPKGFIVHPFADQKDQLAYFLEASFHLKFSLENEDVFENNWENTEDYPKERKQEIIKSAISDSQSNAKVEGIDTAKNEFISMVENARNEISKGALHKVVPARVKKIALEDDFDPIHAILNLCKAYPNAFINFFHLPNLGTWIGASPEILIATKGDEFHTMSLAGTQKASGENPLKTASWTQKEIEEQALVSRYIVDCFKKIRLREYLESGPKTVLAGNLLHLRSDFKVNMEATNFPQLGSVMLQLLHPTSAVCGMPRQEALDFLRKNEPFDRSFYAGFLGPVNVDQETSIYVNLRTARLLDKKAILYAGAGVTEDSNPEKEWEETEIKCEIIRVHLTRNQKS